MNSSGSPGEFVRRQFLRLAFYATAGAVVAPALTGPSVAEPGVDLGEYLSSRPGQGRFPLVAGGRAAPLVVSAGDHAGVVRVAGDLRADIERVTGVRPARSLDTIPRQDEVVLIGTIGASPLIDGLIGSGRLDTTGIAGAWETSLQQVVDNPLPGVRRAFVIAGSDQRGTIFGAYDVSRAIGVSPWYWWADVPARHQDELYVRPGRYSQGTPVVKYRGLFINDENPGTRRLGPCLFRARPRAGLSGGLQQQALFAGLRTHVAAQGEPSLARRVGSRVRARRPAEPCHRNGVRHPDGDLARGADAARGSGTRCPSTTRHRRP